jgi:NADH-quinone oxidoreductase subunit J
LNIRQVTAQREGSMPAWILAGIVGLIVVVKLASLFTTAPLTIPSEDFGTIQGVGMLLFTRYLLLFELISVLLLIAIIGAVILAKRRAL